MKAAEDMLCLVSMVHVKDLAAWEKLSRSLSEYLACVTKRAEVVEQDEQKSAESFILGFFE